MIRSVCRAFRSLPLLLAALPLVVHAVAVRESPSCGEWVKARADGGAPQAEARLVERWLIGFISGIAVGAKVDLLRGTDNASLYLWVDNYCRANPLRSVAEGAPALVADLRNKMKPRRPAGPSSASARMS